ncbi:MAG TPA: ATP-binding protein [Gammaproteobacteria bacterium]|nr:ATP-binding protein [Gammaproteobacteria bacterium]
MNIDWETVRAAVWRQHKGALRAVMSVDPVALDSLVGIEAQKTELCRNTERFLSRLPANNALLWGARGTGKSSLIKAVLNEYAAEGLRLIEVFKTDLYHLPDIVDEIRHLPFRFIVYCDDFSFDVNDNSYVALKTLLEGSIEQAPDNVLLYATSNRRHLVPESMQDNRDSHVVGDEVHYADAIEEKISLSDRFGLWLSFYPPTEDGYLVIVDSYFPNYPGDRQVLHKAAKDFARARGSKSGRTARQFFNAYSVDCFSNG